MTLLQSFLVAVSGYFLFDKAILPFAARSNFNGKFAEMTKIGWLSALSFIKKCFLISGLAFGGLLLLLQLSILFGWLFKRSDVLVSGVLSFIVGLNRFFETISDNKTWVVMLLLGLVLLLLTVVKAQKHAREVYERIKSDQKDGKLPPIDDNEQIKEVNENLAGAYSELYYLGSLPAESFDHEEKRKYVWLKKIIPALSAFRNELDVRRRLIPELEKEAAQPKTAGNWKERILLFFSSQGLVNVVAKSSGLVGNIGILILSLSFVAGNGQAVSRSASAQTGQIMEWQLNAEREELNEEWAKNLANSKKEETEESWSDDDEKTLNHISRSIELALADMFSPSDDDDDDAGAVAHFASFRFRSNAIRYQLMQEYAKLPNGKLRPGYKIMEEGARIHAEEHGPAAKSKKWSRTYADHVVSEEPSTPLGKKVREDLRAKIKKAPRAYWTEAKAKWAKAGAAFSKTAKPSEVFGMMVGEAWNDVFANFHESGSMEASVAEEMASKVGKSTVKSWVEFKVDEFIYHLMKGESPEAVMADLKKPGSTTEQFMKYSTEDIEFPKAAERSTTVAEYKPCMEFNDMSTEKTVQARSALEDFSRKAGIESSRVAESVSDFRDIFPGQAGGEEGTMASAMRDGTDFEPDPEPRNSGGGGGGGGGGGRNGSGGAAAEPPHSTPSYAKRTAYNKAPAGRFMAASRARSFSMLRGFRRIGGVLIGRDAQNTGHSGADFRDISWEERPDNRIELFLYNKNGEKIPAGTYSKSIVPQSLAYAADGRLITATMIKAEPLPFLKIFTHPALTNTQVGCKAIGLDRLVDKYASGQDNDRIAQALLAFRFQSLAYEYTAIQLIYNKLHNISSLLRTQNLDSEDMQKFIRQKMMIEQKLNQLKLQLEISWSAGFPLMEHGDLLDNKAESHIAAKPEYYHQRVVRIIQNGFGNCNGSVEAFEKEMETESVNFDSMEEIWKVQTEEWSGVREMEYTVDESLAFLRPAGGQNADLFPLNFIRQIVYIPTAAGQGDVVEASDENPWEFPSLRASGVIEYMVGKGIRANEQDRATFEMMKSFTLLQRLFRSAFNGDLGTDFPVEKLFYLLAATKPFMLETETPTWNVNMPKDYEERLIKYKYTEDALQTYQKVRDVLGINLPKNQHPCN